MQQQQPCFPTSPLSTHHLQHMHMHTLLYVWHLLSASAPRPLPAVLSCRPHHRRMLLCPKGLHADKTYVSVFLDSPEAGWVPDHLNPRATFKLSILCQTGAGEDFCKGESV